MRVTHFHYVKVAIQGVVTERISYDCFKKTKQQLHLGFQIDTKPSFTLNMDF